MQRTNVLLTRYPICLIHGLKNIFHFRNYWHGIPDYLRDHGMDVIELKTHWRGPQQRRVLDLQSQLLALKKKYSKLHVFAHSLGTLDSLILLDKLEKDDVFASLTLVAPLMGGTPWADVGQYISPWLKDFATEQGASKITENLKNMNRVFITAIITDPQYKMSPKVTFQNRLLKQLLKIQKRDTKNDGLIPFESQLKVKKIASKLIFFPGDHVQVVGAGPWPKNVKTAHEVFLEHCIFLAENDIQKAE